jgi:plasmid maintenance system antidote protein VapI
MLSRHTSTASLNLLTLWRYTMTLGGMALQNLARADTLADQVATEILKALAGRRQSQAALARAMEVPAMWVSDRLSGKTQITVNDLERIAEVLGVTIADLLPRRQREVTVTSVEPSTPIHGVPSFDNHPRGGRPSNRTDRRRPTSTTRPAQHGLARTA